MDDPIRHAPTPLREGISTTGPERNWPLNCWWVAAHGSELSQQPTLRWVLEMPIALYRTACGKATALHNRCPHRWAPLHLGEVEGDTLACPYHGFRFDPSGQCVKIPTQPNVPASVKVRSFPTVERYGFVWIWTGEVDRADPALIPADLAYLDDPAWHTVWGYKSVNANFMQLKENVLDLTHFAFLHKHSLGVTDWVRPPAVELTDDRVTYRQCFEMAPLPAVYAVPAGKPIGKPMNRDNWGTQLSPASHHGGVDAQDPDPGEGLARFSLRIIHLTTPVALGKSHYYWAMARDHGDPFDVDKTRAMADVVFGEDIAIVEATQHMARCAIDQPDAVEVSVLADQAAIQGRRQVASRVEAERRG